MSKNSWIVAVGILAVMVFGLTFIMNYLGGRGGPPPDSPKPPEMMRLDFVTPVAHEKDAPVLCELKKLTWYDFWFENRNDKDVAVGLVSKSCKCVRVELYLLAESQRPSLVPMVASRVSLLAGPLGPLAVATLGAAQDNQVRDTASVTGAPLTQDQSTTVPARALGWVRMYWEGERAELRRQGVDLWTEQSNNPAPSRLEVTALVVRPLVAPPEGDVGILSSHDLPRTRPLYCYSATRHDVRVNVAVEHDGRSPAADPLVVGKPERLSEAELAEVAKGTGFPFLRCGFRVPVTLKDKAADGTPFEWGQFQRYLSVTSPDENVEAQIVELRGAVLGDVTVGDRGEGGWVSFGSFRYSEGKKGTITLQSDVPGLDLEVDDARTPAFLQVKLKNQYTSPEGHRTWRFDVTVKPLEGPVTIPASDDAAFRDSAFYVKTKEKPPRSIRVPVRGTANQ
jgi:hypothetical protein